jgi:hypothetical protein
MKITSDLTNLTTAILIVQVFFLMFFGKKSFIQFLFYIFHTVILFLRGAEGLFRFKTINYIICSINKKNCTDLIF